MGLLYGRAGRSTAENGGFRPGQYDRKATGLRVHDADGGRVVETHDIGGGKFRFATTAGRTYEISPAVY